MYNMQMMLSSLMLLGQVRNMKLLIRCFGLASGLSISWEKRCNLGIGVDLAECLVFAQCWVASSVTGQVSTWALCSLFWKALEAPERGVSGCLGRPSDEAFLWGERLLMPRHAWRPVARRSPDFFFFVFSTLWCVSSLPSLPTMPIVISSFPSRQRLISLDY